MSIFRIASTSYPLLKLALQARLLQKTAFMPSVALALACMASLPSTAMAAPPTVTTDGASFNLNIDTLLSFSSSMFGFADVDSGDSLQYVSVTSVPQGGDFFLDVDRNGLFDPQTDFVVSSGTNISTAGLDFLLYAPIAGASGSPYAQMSFRVSDGTNLSNVATIYFNVLKPQPTIVPVPLGSTAWNTLLATVVLLLGLRIMRPSHS